MRYGGIGKTQMVLEYVYINKSTYRAIYWVTAVNQASLLTGYQKICKAAQLKVLAGGSAVEIAELVVRWLEQQESWLFIIDNLDDISRFASF